MQSRRDLFQAHRLMTQRASLALLRGEPDIPDQPLRRLNVAAFTGVLVAVIVTALFLIWGLLGHGGSSVRNQPGTLIIDKQTGQSYVFCQHGKLCPVVNYASARLALRSSAVTQQTVNQAALAKFARGPLIGIPGPAAAAARGQPAGPAALVGVHADQDRPVRRADHHRPGRRHQASAAARWGAARCWRRPWARTG